MKFRILAQVAYGMAYLMEQNVFHKDLKSLNVLLDASLQVKITDFGLATHQKLVTSTMASQTNPTAARAKQASGGSYPWMSPERLKSPYLKYNESCDVYSYGVVMFEVLFQEEVWEGLDLQQIKDQVINEQTRPTLAIQDETTFEDLEAPLQNLQSLVEACWAQDSQARPSFRSIKVSLEKHLRQHFSKEDQAWMVSGSNAKDSGDSDARISKRKSSLERQEAEQRAKQAEAEKNAEVEKRKQLEAELVALREEKQAREKREKEEKERREREEREKREKEENERREREAKEKREKEEKERREREEREAQEKSSGGGEKKRKTAMKELKETYPEPTSSKKVRIRSLAYYRSTRAV